MAAPTTSPDDIPFQHFTLKHRVIAWISSRMFDKVTYTVRYGLLKGLKRKGGLGWIPSMLAPGTVTAEHEFWETLDLKGLTVYDVGAFQGLLTLFFASRAKQVVCFEPNDGNHWRLRENLALNGIKNVEVRKMGVGSRREICKMAGNPLMPGGSSVDSRIVEELLRAGVATVVQEIQIVTLDEEIEEADLPRPDFIKIDIEGWEIEALRGARRSLEKYRPALFLEMHGETVREKKRKVAEIVDFLWDIGYRQIRHVETGTSINPENSATAKQGHLYCRAC